MNAGLVLVQYIFTLLTDSDVMRSGAPSKFVMWGFPLVEK